MKAAGRRPAPGYAIDLLLADRRHQTPIVAEIKCPKDTNPFFGLIQALTYAVELITPAQRARLQRYYPNHFRERTAGPFVEIWLVLVDVSYSDEDWQTTILSSTRQLAEALLTDESEIASLIRRVRCFRARLVAGEQAERASLTSLF